MDAVKQNDVQLLRKVVARELDTISEYEIFADAAKDPLVKSFFAHLADEEKEHVAEAMALIAERDTVQKNHMDGVDIRPEHFNGTDTQKTTSVASSNPQKPKGFTVGTLKRK